MGFFNTNKLPQNEGIQFYNGKNASLDGYHINEKKKF